MFHEALCLVKSDGLIQMRMESADVESTAVSASFPPCPSQGRKGYFLRLHPDILLCFLPGLLPRPSIRAEPGPVVARGRPVTILCRGPAGAHRFRLEQKENILAFMDQKSISQRGSLETEARFLIPTVSEVTAVPYRCAYKKGSNWSERSDVLELKLTDEDVPVRPSGLSQVPGPCPQLYPLSSGSLPSCGPPGLWLPCPSAHMSLGLHTRLRPWSPGPIWTP